MKRLLMLIVGILLLIIAFQMAGNTGTQMAGGTGKGITIPVGTVKVEVKTDGK